MNIQDLLSRSIGKTVTSCKIGGETNSILIGISVSLIKI